MRYIYFTFKVCQIFSNPLAIVRCQSYEMAEPSEDLSVRPQIPEDKLVLYVKKGKIVLYCDQARFAMT